MDPSRRKEPRVDELSLSAEHVHLSEIIEAGTKGSGGRRIPAWESNLASAIGQTFGVKPLFGMAP